MNVNVWDVSDSIQTLISKGSHVEDAQLSDADTSLESLAAAS
jgi:hypothetical protein